MQESTIVEPILVSTAQENLINNEQKATTSISLIHHVIIVPRILRPRTNAHNQRDFPRPGLAITVNFFPRLIHPLLHGEPVSPGRGRPRQRHRLIFLSVTCFCKIYGRNGGGNIDAAARWSPTIPVRTRKRRERWRTARSSLIYLTCGERCLVLAGSLPAERATTIRIEGTGHGSTGAAGAGSAIFGRAEVLDYAEHVPILHWLPRGSLAPRVRTYSCVFRSLPPVYTRPRSLARKWINVINGQRGKKFAR